MTMMFPIFDHMQKENRHLRATNAELAAALLALVEWFENVDDVLTPFQAIAQARAALIKNGGGERRG